MCNMIVDFFIELNFWIKNLFVKNVAIIRICDKKERKNGGENKKNLTNMGICVIIDDNPKK